MSSQRLNDKAERGSELVPEDFDLDDMRNIHSRTEVTDREHCPKCHKMSMRKRNPARVGTEFEHHYKCKKCGHTFDEPIPHEEATDWR